MMNYFISSYPSVHILPDNNSQLSTPASEINFPYIHTHLEYMLFEILKNAMRATVEYTTKLGGRNFDISNFDKGENKVIY